MNQSLPSPSYSPHGFPPPPPINYHQARSPAPISSQSAAQPARYVHRDLSSPNLLSPLNHTSSPSTGPNALRQASGGASPLSSPHGGILSPQTGSGHSPMAMRGPSIGGPVVGYNPQQWGSNGPAGGAFVPHAVLAPTARPANPEDGILDAPPPYSQEPATASTPTPPASQHGRPQIPYQQSSSHSQQHSSASNFTPIPASAISLVSPAGNLLRSGMTPANPQPMNFPPPPGAPNSRDRSVSRTGRSRFGLSALARGISSDRVASHTPEQPVLLNQTPTSALVVPRPRPTPGRVSASTNRSSVYIQSTQPIVEPPSARRSASAGAVTNHGLAVPPPPPGPPPAAPRTAHGESHHRNGSIQLGNDLVPILSMPSAATRRPPRILPGGTSLGPVPPTPAGWVDNSETAPPPMPSPLHDGSSEASYEPSEPSGSDRVSRRDDSSASGFRTHERRDSTVKGLRERRSESRQARDRDIMSPDGEEQPSFESKLADLTLNLNSSNLNRQGAVKKSRSSMSPKDPPSATRVQVTSRRGDTGIMSPPVSSNQPPTPHSGRMSSKALPIPPAGDKSHPRGSSRPPTEVRQSSAAGKRRAVTPEGSSNAGNENFAKLSVERHELFIQQELAARTDRERLELFAEYIVMESRLRRDRYSSAFSGMASEILDMTRDLWRPMGQQTPKAFPSPAPPLSARRSNGTSTPQARPEPNRQESSDSHNTDSPLSSRENWTPRTESESPTSIPSAGPRDTNFRQYQPVLSPIPSMAMSTVPDGESRGRSASRWWESDDGSVGGGRQVERTKRESKYMGLGRVARFNLQYEDEPSPALLTASTPGRAGSSSEYPPEKVGWHDAAPQESVPTPGYFSMPNTPSATVGLDVSRLVTLPPPYPRHYPALSNAHPDLGSVRATIRSLNEIAIINETKQAFNDKIDNGRAVAARESVARISKMRHDIAEQVQLGQMSFANAATAEEQFHKQEAKAKQSAVRKEYSTFQPEVHDPLKALLQERVTSATASINQLNDSLSTSASETSPDAAMEEGDERPELLEKLKLLKWLVEAREMLHRELFNLESERCDRYRDLIVSDLEGRGEAPNKIDEAVQFFQKDSLERWATFERDARSRMEKLLTVVERHVDRGVQDQLSAFWDIGPGLLELVKKIPLEPPRLSTLKVSIPHSELAENPSYGDYPLQYLYGLLCHAEKATYQFIENQVGLWCLANEVGVSVMRASLSVVRAERCLAENRPRDDQDVATETTELAKFEENRLNRELKDRVGEVESQWKEALGSDLSAALERVEWTLREIGGWDENLQE